MTARPQRPTAPHVCPECGQFVLARWAEEMEERFGLESAGDELLLTVPEAARLLSVSSTTMKGLVARGEIPALRIGTAVRVRKADLVLWVGSRTGGSTWQKPPIVEDVFRTNGGGRRIKPA